MSDSNPTVSWLLPVLSVFIAYQHLQLSRERLAFEKAQRLEFEKQQGEKKL